MGVDKDFIEWLKQGNENSHLPTDPKEREEILALFPPPEELDRLYREAIEKDEWLTFEECFGPVFKEFGLEL